jgi:uncharacterized membrane protein
VITPGFFTVERVLVLMAAVSAIIAVVGKFHCRSAGWTTPDQYSTVCWSVFPNSLVADKLAVFFPFFSPGSPFDQSVFAGWIAGTTAWLTQASGGGAQGQLAFFDVNAALLAVAWIATVIVVARTAGRRSWDAALVAASPVLMVAIFVSWDFWAAALVSLAIFLFARRWTLWAGAVLGIAALAAPYAILVLAALLLLGIRAGRVTRMLEMTAAASIAWLVALVPLMVKNPPAFPNYLQGWFAKEPSESSIYGGWNLVADRLGLPGMDIGMANAIAAILLVALILGVAYLALCAPARPRAAQLVFVAVAGWVVLGKNTEPWHAVWLVPLLALALPRWRPVLLWQAAAIAHFIALMLYRSKELGGISSQNAIDAMSFVLASWLAGMATCVLIGLVIRDIYVPGHDVVRRGGVDDPQGGVLLDPNADPKLALLEERAGTPAVENADNDASARAGD